MSLITRYIRKNFKKGDDIRDAGQKTPDDIERWDDIYYGPDKKWQIMDVYRPKNTTGKLPVIVSVHGGAWCYGDKELYQWYTMSLAQRGFAVVNFTYRLADEFKFPAAIEDTNSVIKWIIENDEWFDLDHIFMVGDSAGGHMATIYSALCTNPEYAAKLGIEPPKFKDGRSFVPNAVGLNCGAYEISFEDKHTRALMRNLLKKKGNAYERDVINPIPYVNEKFPRAFVMTANADHLLAPPAQMGLVRKLEECGVEVVNRTYGSDDNPLGHVFHCDMRSADAAKCNDDECDFFKKA